MPPISFILLALLYEYVSVNAKMNVSRGILEIISINAIIAEASV